MESIGTLAFAYNALSGELDLSMYSKLTSIDYRAFGYNQITSIKLPDSITNIGIGAFSPNALISVTFYGRSDLTGVTIGTSAWDWADGYSDANIYFINE